MTYPKYTQQALSRYNLPRLKRIAAELGVTPTGDRRATETWVNAIITHQSTQLQKVDNQALAQAELDHFIADQAQVVAPEPLRIIEISFDHHEYYADDKLIASISHDNSHLTQRWVVMVNDKEVFRANTLMRCDRFICTHYKDGSLPVQEEAGGQGPGGRGEKFSPMHPAPCSLSSSTTGNEIMVQIFAECEKYGFEILNDGIYRNNVRLGEVGCTDGGWWLIQASSVHQQKIACDSVESAVQSLSVIEVSSVFCDELLDRAFDELSASEWRRLLEYQTVFANSQLVAA
ncbi:hypothetical protein [Nostoc sp. FACHB-888]|uniref:hypothetical protein n=1 Tax=Nostoc sp. FACHB-888 TaxID=2692842 RepID=UPI001681D626|nr:hypothetical protein [Nostoc sp. FACHB-888]MBD2248758.1 hypothetical protein [Nostoc sp. FACHB-888]